MIDALKAHPLIFLFLNLCILLGLSTSKAEASQPGSFDSNITRAAYEAADQLEANLAHELNRVKLIVSTDLVNLDQPNARPSLGIMLGKQIASRLAQHGYRIVERRAPTRPSAVKKHATQPPPAVEPREIELIHGVQAMLVGDYVISNDLAYVSVRLISVPENIILTSSDFTMRLDDATKEMAAVKTPLEVPRTQSTQKTEAPAHAATVKGTGKSSDPKPSATNPKQSRSTEEVQEAQAEDPFATGSVALNPANRLGAKIIQSRLAELGFYKAEIDGIWKKHSKAALKAFKESRGLRYATRWDMNTQKALFQNVPQ